MADTILQSHGATLSSQFQSQESRNRYARREVTLVTAEVKPGTVIEVPPGLDGVIVATTSISELDGVHGRLSYRGVPIADVLRRYPTWDELVPWLVTGASELVDQDVLAAPPTIPAFRDPMARLTATVLALADGSDTADVRAGLRLITAIPTYYAACGRRSRPLASRNTAANFLAAMTGKTPTAVEVAALNTYWILAAEHSMNASTFAVRVAASTGASLALALAAGIGTLSGPLHGGAPTGVLELVDQLAESPHPADTLGEMLGRGERIMGFGHRVYRTEDPRAAKLREVLASLGGTTAAVEAVAMEHAAAEALKRFKPDRELAVNVEFYAGLVLKALGIAAIDCPPTFACARLAGWAAHYYEQRRDGRLIRPLARFVPPRP